MKVTVDHDLCIGDAICESIAPDVFELRDDGLAWVIVETVEEDRREDMEESVDACPTDAIIIFEDDDEIDERLLASIDPQ